jgi:hypothetical protein
MWQEQEANRGIRIQAFIALPPKGILIAKLVEEKLKTLLL